MLNTIEYDVIIVGAGIAGLAAGEFLQQAGKKILILEAQARVGGRIWTDDSLGFSADLGASWIHGSMKNPITKLTEKYQIPTVPSNVESLSLKRYDSLCLYDWEGKRVSPKEIQHLKRQLEEFEIFVKNAQTILTQDVSYYSILKEFIHLRKLKDRELKIFKYAVRAAIEYEYAEDMRKLSFLEFGKDTPFSSPDVLFPKGYDEIPKKMAEKLPVLLKHKVEAIHYDQEKVEVCTKMGNFSARAVIITIPLALLKNAMHLFKPELPPWKKQAIRRIQIGLLNKVFLKFKEVFWDAKCEVIGFIPTSKLSWIEFINLYPYFGEPVLLAFNAGSKAREMEKWSADEIVDSIMNVMKTIYGKEVPAPEKHLLTTWNKFVYARGSYSYLPVGVSQTECEKLAEPVLDRLYFAGEATNYKMLGTVHGAYLSGIETAKRILSHAN